MNIMVGLSAISAQLSTWLVPYLEQGAMMLVATLMVVYGDVLNRAVKAALKGYHLMLRMTLFMLLCAFGYGALALLATPLLVQGFKSLPYAMQGSALVLSFVLLGYFAERRRYI